MTVKHNASRHLTMHAYRSNHINAIRRLALVGRFVAKLVHVLNDVAVNQLRRLVYQEINRTAIYKQYLPQLNMLKSNIISPTSLTLYGQAVLTSDQHA